MKKTVKNTVVKIGITMIVIMLLAGIFTGCGKKTEGFMTIDGETISEDQFRFFCSLVLEDESFAYTAYYDLKQNFTEAVKEETVAFVREYVCRLKAAEKNGFVLSPEEKKQVAETADKEFEKYSIEYGFSSTEEEFYDMMYGITKEEYLKFRENWLIIDKYNEKQYSEADVSEEAQKAAYERFESFLNTRKTAVIVVDTKDKTNAEKNNAKQMCELLLNKVKNGEDIFELMKQYSTDKSLTEGGGTIEIGASFQTTFPNLYKWARDAKQGDCGLVTEEDGLYVVKCIEINTFDNLKNTDEMIEWTRFAETQKAIDNLVIESKLKEDVDRVKIDSCDISDLVTQAIEYWTSLWDAYGFPATAG